jgi:hypothetical protein
MTVLFIRANRISPIAKDKQGGSLDAPRDFRDARLHVRSGD